MICPRCDGDGYYYDVPESCNYEREKRTCPLCLGTGAVKKVWKETCTTECDNCQGKGKIRRQSPRYYASGMPSGEYDKDEIVKCGRCNGTGRIRYTVDRAEPDRTTYSASGESSSSGCAVAFFALSMLLSGLMSVCCWLIMCIG